MKFSFFLNFVAVAIPIIYTFILFCILCITIHKPVAVFGAGCVSSSFIPLKIAALAISRWDSKDDLDYGLFWQVKTLLIRSNMVEYFKAGIYFMALYDNLSNFLNAGYTYYKIYIFSNYEWNLRLVDVRISCHDLRNWWLLRRDWRMLRRDRRLLWRDWGTLRRDWGTLRRDWGRVNWLIIKIRVIKLALVFGLSLPTLMLTARLVAIRPVFTVVGVPVWVKILN